MFPMDLYLFTLDDTWWPRRLSPDTGNKFSFGDGSPWNLNAKYHLVPHTWPSDPTWWQRSGSPLAQAMACCLTAPSHHMNQCWHLIGDILWHSLVSNLTASGLTTILYNEFGSYNFKITAPFPMEEPTISLNPGMIRYIIYLFWVEMSGIDGSISHFNINIFRAETDYQNWQHVEAT